MKGYRRVKNTSLLVIFLIIVSVFALTSCNYQVLDLTYSYDYAIIKLQNGKIVEGKVQQWRDYEDGEQLQVTVDGVTYLTNSFNCTLIDYP